MSSSLPKWLREREKVDASQGCTVNVTDGDIERAKPQNGAHCALARCAKRAFGARHAFFYRSTGYVEFGDGRPVERFVPSKPLFHDVIAPLDAGRFKAIKPGRYELLPPPPSRRQGEAMKRRKRLEALRDKGLAPPPKKRKRKKKLRPVVGRIHSA
jgi:hypothetical protein